MTYANPPFGVGNNKLAKAFIKNALRFSKACAFIVPMAFKNHRITYRDLSRNDTRWRIVHEVDLPADIFTVNGKPYKWACVLQIWLHGDPRNNGVNAPVSQGYIVDSSRTSESPFDMQLCADGGRAGKMVREGQIRSRSTHWQLSFDSEVFQDEDARNTLRGIVNDSSHLFNVTGFGKYHINKYDAIPKLNIMVEYAEDVIRENRENPENREIYQNSEELSSEDMDSSDGTSEDEDSFSSSMSDEDDDELQQSRKRTKFA